MRAHAHSTSCCGAAVLFYSSCSLLQRAPPKQEVVIYFTVPTIANKGSPGARARSTSIAKQRPAEPRARMARHCRSKQRTHHHQHLRSSKDVYVASARSSSARLGQRRNHKFRALRMRRHARSAETASRTMGVCVNVFIYAVCFFNCMQLYAIWKSVFLFLISKQIIMFDKCYYQQCASKYRDAFYEIHLTKPYKLFKI